MRKATRSENNFYLASSWKGALPIPMLHCLCHKREPGWVVLLSSNERRIERRIVLNTFVNAVNYISTLKNGQLSLHQGLLLPCFFHFLFFIYLFWGRLVRRDTARIRYFLPSQAASLSLWIKLSIKAYFTFLQRQSWLIVKCRKISYSLDTDKLKWGLERRLQEEGGYNFWATRVDDYKL